MTILTLDNPLVHLLHNTVKYYVFIRWLEFAEYADFTQQLQFNLLNGTT